MNEYTDTELKKLSNEQIKDLFFKVRSKLFFEHKNNKDVEIYFCYIVREIENRNI